MKQNKILLPRPAQNVSFLIPPCVLLSSPAFETCQGAAEREVSSFCFLALLPSAQMVPGRGDSRWHLTWGSCGNDSARSALLLGSGPKKHASGLSHRARLLQALPTHLFSCHFVTCLENLLLALFIRCEYFIFYFGQTESLLLGFDNTARKTKRKKE